MEKKNNHIIQNHITLDKNRKTIYNLSNKFNNYKINISHSSQNEKIFLNSKKPNKINFYTPLISFKIYILINAYLVLYY